MLRPPVLGEVVRSVRRPVAGLVVMNPAFHPLRIAIPALRLVTWKKLLNRGFVTPDYITLVAA
jgi:hypothetical protein